MRISDWSSDVCSSDLQGIDALASRAGRRTDPLAARLGLVGLRPELSLDRLGRLRDLVDEAPVPFVLLDVGQPLAADHDAAEEREIGSASCSESVGPYV